MSLSGGFLVPLYRLAKVGIYSRSGKFSNAYLSIKFSFWKTIMLSMKIKIQIISNIKIFLENFQI